MKYGRFIALFLALILMTMLFSGCQSSSSVLQDSTTAVQSNTDTSDTLSQTATETKKIKIGMSIDTTNQPWRAGLVNDVKAEAAKHPEVELIVTDGQGDSNKQISDVEDLITRQVDVIMISPHEGQPLTPVCVKAYEAGIPVLVLDRSLETDKYTSFIGANNRAIGQSAGEYILKYMTENNLTKVVELQGTPGSSPCRDRSEPFVDEMKKNSNITIVAQQTANWNENEALQVTENMLQANPKGSIDLIYAQCDAMALGAIKAIKAAGREEIKIVSIDGQKQALEAIQAGTMLGTFTYPFPGAEGVRVAIKIANGETVDKLIEIPSVFIDSTNVDQLYDPNSPF